MQPVPGLNRCHHIESVISWPLDERAVKSSPLHLTGKPIPPSASIFLLPGARESWIRESSIVNRQSWIVIREISESWKREPSTVNPQSVLFIREISHPHPCNPWFPNPCNPWFLIRAIRDPIRESWIVKSWIVNYQSWIRFTSAIHPCNPWFPYPCNPWFPSVKSVIKENPVFWTGLR